MSFCLFFIVILEVLLRWKVNLLRHILWLCAKNSILYFSDRIVVGYTNVRGEPLDVWCWIKLEMNVTGWRRGRKCKASVDCIVPALQGGRHTVVCSCPRHKTELTAKFTARVEEWCDGYRRRCYYIFKLTQFYAFLFFFFLLGTLCSVVTFSIFNHSTTQSWSSLWAPEIPFHLLL